MRQWLVDPKILCTKHLLGEHVEHHMFVGAILKKKTLDGFLSSNLLEPTSLVKRHLILVEELLNRGFKHKSDLQFFDINYFSEENKLIKIDVEKSLKDLIGRCKNCRERYLSIINNGTNI